MTVDAQQLTGPGTAVERFALPPVAVFCDPSEPHELPCLGADARRHADRVSSALAAIPAFGGPAERDAGLRAAARATAGLVGSLARDAEPVDGDQLPTRSHVQGCFRVRTTALTARQAALHAAVVIQSAIVDLRNAPLAGSDLARETAAMRQVVVDLAGSEGDAAAGLVDDDEQIEAVPVSAQREVWLMRMATIATTPVTPRAEAALREFARACDTAGRTIRLAPRRSRHPRQPDHGSRPHAVQAAL